MRRRSLREQRFDAIRDGDLDRLMWAWDIDVDALMERAPANVQRSLRMSKLYPDLVGMPGHQNFSELIEPVMHADLAAVSPAAATETVLWTPNTSTVPFTSIIANTVRSGQVFKLRAGGLMTVPVTPGTVTITPRWGTSTAGVSLGPSTAIAGTASQTNVPWIIQCQGTVRTTGAGTATTGVVVMVGTFESVGLTRDMVFGGTTATVDTTGNQGIVFGITDSVISLSYTPKIIALEWSG